MKFNSELQFIDSNEFFFVIYQGTNLYRYQNSVDERVELAFDYDNSIQFDKVAELS